MQVVFYKYIVRKLIKKNAKTFAGSFRILIFLQTKYMFPDIRHLDKSIKNRHPKLNLYCKKNSYSCSLVIKHI